MYRIEFSALSIFYDRHCVDYFNAPRNAIEVKKKKLKGNENCNRREWERHFDLLPLVIFFIFTHDIYFLFSTCINLKKKLGVNNFMLFFA